MVLTALLFSLVAAEPLPAGTLVVNAVGFNDDEGKAIVYVYASEETWTEGKDPKKAMTVKIQKGKATARLDGIAPGTYAVSVVHDENENGEMDFSWFPIPGPDEGVGAANDAPASMGPPEWKEAKLTLGTVGRAITIRTRY